MADLFQVTADAGTGSARIVAQVAGAASMLAERRIAGGEWEKVRVMNPWNGPKAIGVRDFECPFDVDVEYRLTAKDAGGAVVGTTMAAQVKVTGVYYDWIRPITRPLTGMKIWVESYPVLSRQGRVGTFDVLGRSDRVAITSVRARPKGTLTLLTMNDVERIRMLNILNSGEPIVFVGPAAHGVGRQYLVVFDVQEERIARFAPEQARRWVLQVEEIGYPAGYTAEWDFQTWGEVKDSKITWGAVPATYPKWMDVPETSPAIPPDPGTPHVASLPTPTKFGV